MTTSNVVSLINKLCEVMAAVDHVEKKGHNRDQNYDFARDVDVSAALRIELASRKVFMTSSITRVETELYQTKSGGRGAINTVYTEHAFIDGESGERLEFAWVSQGMDGQDKGVSKGATSAIKYALLKQFLIPTGDDPDEGKMDEPDRPVSRLPKPTPASPAAAIAHKDATPTNCSDVARKWFFATLKEQCGIGPDEAKALLGIKSLQEDMGDKTFEAILGFVKMAILRAQKAAVDGMAT